MKFEKVIFKLTKEMIKIIQGTQNEAYNICVDMTFKVFLLYWDYMNNLLDFVYLMFISG